MNPEMVINEDGQISHPNSTRTAGIPEVSQTTLAVKRRNENGKVVTSTMSVPDVRERFVQSIEFYATSGGCSMLASSPFQTSVMNKSG